VGFMLFITATWGMGGSLGFVSVGCLYLIRCRRGTRDVSKLCVQMKARMCGEWIDECD
jgi:hypothetical protein